MDILNKLFENEHPRVALARLVMTTATDFHDEPEDGVKPSHESLMDFLDDELSEVLKKLHIAGFTTGTNGSQAFQGSPIDATPRWFRAQSLARAGGRKQLAAFEAQWDCVDGISEYEYEKALWEALQASGTSQTSSESIKAPKTPPAVPRALRQIDWAQVERLVDRARYILTNRSSFDAEVCDYAADILNSFE